MVSALDETLIDTPAVIAPDMTLEDTVGAPDAPTSPPAKPVKVEPMSTQQILGLVALASSFGLPPMDAEEYRADLTGDITILWLLEMTGLSAALAEMGVSADGGKLPPWLSALLGVGVLGYAVYTKRGKYAGQETPLMAHSSRGGGDAFPDLMGGGDAADSPPEGQGPLHTATGSGAASDD